MPSRNIKISIAILLTLLPALVWIRMNKNVHPRAILAELRAQYDDITFISLDYSPSKKKFLGLERDVYTGRFHTGEGDSTRRYQFTADAYTGEMMEAVEL